MNVNFKIEEELSNVRSNQFSFKVIIENESSEKIELQSLTPKVPDGVIIEEKRDTFKESNRERFDNLCIELTRLLDNLLRTESELLRDNIAQVRTDLTKKFIFSFNGIYKTYLTFMFRNRREEFLKQVSLEYNAYRYRIRSYSDACWAYEKYFMNSEDSIIKGFFEGKLKQLEGICKNIDSSNSLVLAHIEPNSFYSRSYIIKSKRNAVNQKMFNFSIDCQFVGDDKLKIQRRTASTSIVVSAVPFILSFITMISGLLGVVLKTSFNSMFFLNVQSYFNYLGKSLITGPGISAILVSLVFFNILEFTDMGKKINIGINWRSALLIGILSGLMAERLIDAIKIFVGLQ